jgi:PKD repeat protein
VSTLASTTNHGWPCREGVGVQTDWTGLDICIDLANQPGSTTAPYYTYAHSAQVVAGGACPTGSSSISGLAFYQGGSYPSDFDGALFFADYSRDCIFVMKTGSNGLPDPSKITEFRPAAIDPVDLVIGPNGDLFYVDFGSGGAGTGTIRRIAFPTSNQSPTAVASAVPTSGQAPLAVAFDGTDSSDPNAGDSLTYAWDLDADGAYDDSTSATPSRTYTTAGTVVVGLRVTDESGASDTDTVTINVTSGSGGGTTLFSDGFESGGLTAWTLNSGVVATTAEHYAGSYGGRATATNSRAYAYRTLAASQTDLTVSVRFKVLSQSGTIYLVRTASPTGKYGGGVYRTSSGALAFRNTVTATTLTSATTISAGVWHELRLRQVIGTSGTVEIWLDGLRVNDIAASQNLGSESIARFQIGDNNNGRTFDYAFDEALATAP